MSDYDQSFSFLVPVAAWDSVRAIAAGMGYGDLVSVALSATGADPVTHYDGHAWVQQSFADTLSALINDAVLPPELVGHDATALQAIMQQLIYSIAPDVAGQARANFDALCAANNLQKIVEIVE